MRANILSMTAVDVVAGFDDTVNRWYDERHMPDHVACPGFVRGARYASVRGGLRYLALYDIAEESAFTTPEVAAAGAEGWGAVLPYVEGVVSRRYEHAFGLDRAAGPRVPAVAPYLVWVLADARSEQAEAELCSWFDGVFAPQAVALAAVRGVSRYTAVGAGPRTLALVEVDDRATADALRLGPAVAGLRTLLQATYRTIFDVLH